MLNNIKRAFTILLIVVYSLSSVDIYAQTSTSTIGQFAIVKKGDITKFDGVLFNIPATAVILADKDLAIDGFKLKMNFELDKQKTDFNLQINNLKLDLGYQKEIDINIIQAKDKELTELRNIALNNSNNTLLYLAGGIVGGILFTLLTVYAVKKITP